MKQCRSDPRVSQTAQCPHHLPMMNTHRRSGPADTSTATAISTVVRGLIGDTAFVHCRAAPAHTVPRDTHTSSTHLPPRTSIQQPDIAPPSATCTSQTLQMRSSTTPDAPRDFAALQDPQSPDHSTITITTTTSLQSTRTSSNNCASLGVRARNLHTPPTSRDTLAASTASTSRHRCSVIYHNTAVAAKLVIHDARCGALNNQWHTRVARLVTCQPRAAPHRVSTNQHKPATTATAHLLCDHVRQSGLAIVTCIRLWRFAVVFDCNIKGGLR